MYRIVPLKMLRIEFPFRICRIDVTITHKISGMPNGIAVHLMSFKQYTTRMSIIIGGICFSKNSIVAPGFFLKKRKGKSPSKKSYNGNDPDS